MNLLSRVRRTLLRHELVNPGERLLVAVSGGADSVGLLHLLHRIAPEMHLTLGVAHLDHGLRGEEGAGDARFVADLARSLGLHHAAHRADVRREAGECGVSIEMAARDVRYRWLAEAARAWGATSVATAHTADDLAETVLLFLIRGAGHRGLRGFEWKRPLAEGVSLVRPLRSTSRSDIREFLTREWIDWRNDSSNDKPTHLRNRVRQELMPVLEKRFNPRIVKALGRAADRWSEADEFLEARSREALSVALVHVEPGRVCLDASLLERYDRTLHGRVLRAAAALVVPRPLNEVQTRALVRLARAPDGTLPLLAGFHAIRRGNRITIETGNRQGAGGSVAGAMAMSPLGVPGQIALDGPAGSESFLQASLDEGRPEEGLRDAVGRAVLDWDALFPPLAVRHPRPGDRMRPLGMSGRRKLQDILVDRKVPREDRARLWIVEDQERILWLVGIVMCEEAKVTGFTTRRLVLERVGR